MTTDIEKIKAYAKELEGIIQDVHLETSTRILVNALVGRAKQKFDMYD